MIRRRFFVPTDTLLLTAAARPLARWLSVALLAAVGCGTSDGNKGGTGGAGGGSPADAGADRTAASDAGASSDATDTRTTDGRSPDADVFGIQARALVQTCKPPPAVDQPVAKLSLTGCVDPTDARKPASSLIPYDVNSPLWSDGAAKLRFLALPDGATIHVKDCAREPATCMLASQGGTTYDEGHWILPVGTVLMKSFSFAGKLIETRLFVRFADLWYGYSYQWDSGQTDATLVSENGLNAPIVNDQGASQSWYYPSRNDCLECHNDTVGASLGPETRQFNRTFAYPSGVTANQIATLEHIGVFDAPVTRFPALTDYTRDTAAADLEVRARSYLHANCAICHRPDGNYSAIDLRVGVPLAQMSICNLDPNKGDLGVTGAKRLVPAMPAKSLLLLRMQALDRLSGRMPQLATSVLDRNGIDTISAWINSITSCP
jgi:uncharacterized repeat protein (TIGR03806 family)